MLPLILFLCAVTSVVSSEITSPPPSPPTTSTMALETWELALIVGCGTLALLMCAYSVYILMVRRSTAKLLTSVIVDIENGRATKEKNPAAKKETKAGDKKETKAGDKKETKAGDKKETKAGDKKDAKATVAKQTVKGETSAEVIAVKIMPNNTVACPGGGKACIGFRKEGVQTIQPNKLPAPHKIRRDSAPSRIAGGRSSAPRV